MLAYFFYRSVWACIPLSVLGAGYFCLIQKRRLEQEREELAQQFKECILSVAASLKAGYAVENAFLESREDMEMLYGRDSPIYRELEAIRRGLMINITLEEQLYGLAHRSRIEEIEQFATVFSVAKRSGGDLADIIRNTAELIGGKLDAREEMRVMLSGRQMELNVMKLMPFGVLAYVGMGYSGYFDMLYHNWQGVLIMTGCLLLYLAAFCMGERMMQRIAGELL